MLLQFVITCKVMYFNKKLKFIANKVIHISIV